MPTVLVALAAISLAQAGVTAEAKPPPRTFESRRFELFTAASVGNRPTSGRWGGTAMVGASYRVFSWLRPELLVGYGLFDGPFELVTIIRIGTRLELPLSFPLHPYLWVAFAHNHEMGIDHVAQHPVDAVLGTSENGVAHRSGAEVGFGAAYDVVAFRDEGLGFRVGLRATAALFSGSGPIYGDLLTTLGVTF